MSSSGKRLARSRLVPLPPSSQHALLRRCTMILMITIHLLIIHESVTYADEHLHTSLLGHGESNALGNNAFRDAINNAVEKSWRIKRDPFGINARGFHVDVFSRDFGNFKPYKRNERSLSSSATRDKRNALPDAANPKIQVEMAGKRKAGKSRVHEPEQDTMDKETRIVKPYGKRYYSASSYRLRNGGGFPKRRPTNDFYGDAFTHGFGDFSTMKKRRPSSDFHGDAFTEGFGDFETMRKRRLGEIGALTRGSPEYAPINKRRPEADFHDNIFTQGFGDFDVMRKRRPDVGFHDNIFTQGFGDFETMKKRRPSSDFHGDAFTEGFGDFSTMKKRRPSDDFHGNAFTEGFGDFSTMKKRRPNDDFHGDAFTEGFGDFSTMKKRRPSDDFHGDAFTEGFGDFSTMRKRDVEATKAERNNETHDPSIENQKQQLQAKLTDAS